MPFAREPQRETEIIPAVRHGSGSIGTECRSFTERRLFPVRSARLRSSLCNNTNSTSPAQRARLYLLKRSPAAPLRGKFRNHIEQQTQLIVFSVLSALSTMPSHSSAASTTRCEARIFSNVNAARRAFLLCFDAFCGMRKTHSCKQVGWSTGNDART